MGPKFRNLPETENTIKHMNLRHVHSVSQSYIGNTALLYTSKQGWGAQSRTPARTGWAPAPAPLTALGPGGAAEPGKGHFRVVLPAPRGRRERRSAGGSRHGAPVPRDPASGWFCQKQLPKNQKTYGNAPPETPKKKPQTLTLRLMLPLNKSAYIFHINTVKKSTAPNPRLLTKRKFSIYNRAAVSSLRRGGSAGRGSLCAYGFEISAVAAPRAPRVTERDQRAVLLGRRLWGRGWTRVSAAPGQGLYGHRR